MIIINDLAMVNESPRAGVFFDYFFASLPGEAPPNVAKLAIPVFRVNVDLTPDIAESCGVTTCPTLLIMEYGVIVERYTDSQL